MSEEIISRLEKIFRGMVDNIGVIDRTENLSDLGLDSMKSISFLLEIEKEFGIVIPDEKLIPKYFESLNSVGEVVSELYH